MALPALLRLLILLFSGLCLALRSQAQPALHFSADSAVYRIDFPGRAGGASELPRLRLSPFSPDRCQLLDAELDIPSLTIIPKDSSAFSTPLALCQNSWEQDPAVPQWFWTRAYAIDSVALIRYDRSNRRLDTFSIHQKPGYLLRKAGIWLADHNEMLLLSRDNGRVLRRKNNPNPGWVMDLRPWGDDLLVTNHLYLADEDRFVPFQPVPADLQGCVDPNDVKYEGECCLSNAYYQNGVAKFISLPGYPTQRIPIREPCSFLAADPPMAWFISPDALRSFRLDTGDTLAYPTPASEPLRGDPGGRFLGLVHELGLAFFDKKNCRFGYLELPFGFAPPRHYFSDQRYVYLSYADHWEIIQVDRLPPAFKPSSILADFETFQQTWMTLYWQNEQDFYGLYTAFLPIYKQFKALNNPKIEGYWPSIFGGLAAGLHLLPDSILDRVAADYRAGKFLPEIVPDLAIALFQYYSRTDSLDAALALASFYPEKVEELPYGTELLQSMQQAKWQLDSLAGLPLAADERLYHLGNIWYALSLKKIIHSGAHEPAHFSRAYAYYQQLIREHPKSPLADNATYNQLNWIDYEPQTTDDMTFPGDPQRAYQTFRQFLEDYPASEHRPDVLLRLARLLLRSPNHGPSGRERQEEAAQYLQTLAREYPALAQQSDEYKNIKGHRDQQLWSGRWALSVSTPRERYTKLDSIPIQVRWINISRETQVLDSLFLTNWPAGMRLHLSLVHEKDCADVFGDFPLLRMRPLSISIQDTLIPAQQFYEETFLLAPASVTRNYYPGSFSLQAHSQYRFNLEYKHAILPWHRATAPKGGLLTIE